MGTKACKNAMVTVVRPSIYVYTQWMCKEAFKEHTPLYSCLNTSNKYLKQTLLSLTAVLMLEVLSP